MDRMEKILEILKGIRPDVDFVNEKRLIDSGKLDSFDIISVVTDLNQAFGIRINVVHLKPENFNTVEAIENVVETLSKGK